MVSEHPNCDSERRLVILPAATAVTTVAGTVHYHIELFAGLSFVIGPPDHD